MASASKLSNGVGALPLGIKDSELDRFAEVANKVADASGEVIRKYFRNKFEILDKEDLSRWIFIYTVLIARAINWKKKKNLIFNQMAIVLFFFLFLSVSR